MDFNKLLSIAFVLISVVVAATTLSAILRGRQKSFVRLLLMGITFLAWVGFALIECIVAMDPTHPDIRVDLLVVIPLFLLSIAAVVVYRWKG